MIPCIGLSSGLGGANPHCGEGPLFIKKNLSVEGIFWHNLIVPENKLINDYTTIAELNTKLAHDALQMASNHPFFISFGGDHSSAIGLWSGVAEAKKNAGDIGLIWIDAHMDMHTPETSHSGNIHGMPLAAILGRGDKRFTNLLSPISPKIKPENIVLVGIRSYEEEEAELLKEMNVKIYYMEEVQEKGLLPILKKVREDLASRTVGYGVSFDLDSIDPQFATAVGTPVPQGISKDDILLAMDYFSKHPLLALEIVEYIPALDKDLSSFKIIQEIINILTSNVLALK
jgi:arginase